MPWNETISDYVNAERDRKQNRKNDRWAKLMQAAGLGKSIWDTLNEQNKYKPGSDYMKAQELSGKTWPQENAAFESDIDTKKARLDQEIAAAKAAGDYVRAVELEKERAALDMEARKYSEEQANYRARLGAGKELSDKQAKMMTAIQEAFGTAQVRGDWFIPDPVNPNQKVVNPDTIDQLRANILKAIAVYKPTSEDMALLTPYINDLLAGTEATGGAGAKTNQTKPVFAPPPPATKTKPSFQEVTDLAKKLYEAKNRVRANPELTSKLDYIAGQMPRAGFPGGPDYTGNPIEWMASALELVNRILGIATPPPVDKSFRGVGGPLTK